MEKNQKSPPSYKPEETSIDRIESSSPKSVTYRKMENTSPSDILRNFTGGFSWDTESQDYFNYPYFSYSYTNDSDFYNVSSTNGDIDKKVSCQWETAQHSLFQFSNVCFLTAFVIPRNYKSGILLFR